MSRPAGNADKLMIEAGRRIARETGCSALKIREIVDAAGVNLGMFHYHFKSRRRFMRIVLQEVYGEFFDKLTGVANDDSDHLTQLKNSSVLLGQFVRDNRKIVFALFRDIMNDDIEVIRYSRKSMPPHAKVMQELIEKCQQQGLLSELPLHQVVPLLFGAIVQPLLIQEMLEKTGKTLEWFDVKAALSDEAIAQRVELVLAGMSRR